MFTTAASSIIFASCLLAFQNLAQAATETDISRLRADLLRGYDNESRPIQTHNNVTVVTLSFNLNNFDLDEESSLFTAHGWVFYSWKDEHMTWDPSAYGGIRLLQFADYELWKPDLFAYNNVDKSEIDHYYASVPMIVMNNSKVFWAPRAKFQVDCPLDLKNWPFDEQQCEVQMGSWSHSGNDLDLQLPPNRSADIDVYFMQNREWIRTELTFRRRERYFKCCPGEPYVDIFVTFSLKRRSAAHAACVVIPGLVIVTAALASFWISPGSSERLSILLVATFVNFFYLFNVYRMMPNNGDSIPYVVLFYRNSLLILVLSLASTVALRYLANLKRAEPVPLPHLITSCVEGIPGKILCLERRPTNAPGKESGAELEEEKGMNPIQEQWAWLAHLLDRVLFLIFLVTYLLMYFGLL